MLALIPFSAHEAYFLLVTQGRAFIQNGVIIQNSVIQEAHSALLRP